MELLVSPLAVDSRSSMMHNLSSSSLSSPDSKSLHKTATGHCAAPTTALTPGIGVLAVVTAGGILCSFL